MAKTLAERAHNAAVALTKFEDEINAKDADNLSPGDIEKDNERYQELASDAFTLAKQVKERNGTKAATDLMDGVAKDFGLEPGGEAEPTETQLKHEKMASESGLTKPDGRKTVGELFAESPQIQDMFSKGQNTSSAVEVVGDIIKGWLPGVAQVTQKQNDDGTGSKNLITVGSDPALATQGAATLFNQTARLPGLTNDLEPYDFWLSDRVNRVQVDTEIFEWVQVNSRTNASAVVREAQTAEDIGATSSVLAGNPVVDAVLAGLKPESTMDLVVRTERIKTIAHYYHITRFAAADAPRLVTEMNQFLRDGIQETRETEILVGDGTDTHLRGILAPGGQAWGLQTSVIGTDTDLDGLAKALAKVRRRNPDTIIMNSTDYFSSGILLRTDANGNYQLGDPRSTIQQINQIWGMAVRISDIMPAGQFLIGRMSDVTLADRMTTQLYFTDAHRDLFVRNILTYLAEERLAVAVRNPQSFVHVTP